MTRPADHRGNDKEDTMYRIDVYHDDNGWCAEITDGSGDFIGIAIGRTECDAKAQAQSMIKEAGCELS